MPGFVTLRRPVAESMHVVTSGYFTEHSSSVNRRVMSSATHFSHHNLFITSDWLRKKEKKNLFILSSDT